MSPMVMLVVHTIFKGYEKKYMKIGTKSQKKDCRFQITRYCAQRCQRKSIKRDLKTEMRLSLDDF
jgi:hypothetical protein